jgi:predicted ester cyclase
MVQTAFPDQEIELVEVIAEGNFVVGRMIIRGTHQGEFMRIPRTGKRVSAELIELVRIADGKIAERWVQWDRLGLLQQLGANRLPE